MLKEEIIDYVKDYCRTYRQTKNGLFIYSGVYKHPTKYNKTGEIYTYISGEDIGRNYNKEDKDWLIEGLNGYIQEVKWYKNAKIINVITNYER